MLHKEFWGILFLVFVGWTFYPGHPTTRIEHACKPIGWVGNLSTSIAALAIPSQQEKIAGWFERGEYGCRYATWRLLYQDEYLAQQGGAAQGAGGATKPAPIRPLSDDKVVAPPQPPSSMVPAPAKERP